MANLFDVRKKFLENPYTIKNVCQDFPDWHRGRPYYAFWAIDVDCQTVRRQVQAAEQHLAGFLLDGYCRQPHVTLGISGFLSDQPQCSDNYGAVDLEADVSALKSAGIQPFEITIGTLASFSSAPFLHVHDSGRLHALHTLLHSMTDGEHTQYVPHVTVGLYSDAWRTEMIDFRLSAFPQESVASCLVSRISLMCYNASEIGGELVTLADYDLERGVLQWCRPLSVMPDSFRATLMHDI
jgi:2'-5' RNA ligase